MFVAQQRLPETKQRRAVAVRISRHHAQKILKSGGVAHLRRFYKAITDHLTSRLRDHPESIQLLKELESVRIEPLLSTDLKGFTFE